MSKDEMPAQWPLVGREISDGLRQLHGSDLVSPDTAAAEAPIRTFCPKLRDDLGNFVCNAPGCEVAVKRTSSSFGLSEEVTGTPCSVETLLAKKERRDRLEAALAARKSTAQSEENIKPVLSLYKLPKLFGDSLINTSKEDKNFRRI